jgi:oligosaccharyltransferase complex subunit delta (ribophorin II)
MLSIRILYSELIKTSCDSSTMYSLDLLKSKPKRGFYRLSVSVKPAKPDDRLVGHTGAPLQIKVLGAVAVDVAEIGTADADQTTAPKLNRFVCFIYPVFRFCVVIVIV